MSMNNDRLEKLRSLLQTVNESITKQEFVTSFKAVLDFVKQIDAKNTAEFDNFKVQFKHLANSLKLDTEGELDDLKTKVDSTLKDCMAEMMVEHDAKLQAMDKKMSELRDGLDGADGKDADEHKVMEMVLAKIPPLELEPLDVVEKLESLQGEYRLDASAIKNLPEGKGGRWGGGLSRGVADTLYAPIGTTGGVDTANSPLANEFARFTDADTIEGLTVAETLTALGFTASITELNYTDGVTSSIQDQINTKANSSGALTQFVGNTAWRVFYSDGSGDIIELALGADGTFLKSNGAGVAPTFATPSGTGDVSKVGTPVDNQVGVWTGDGTIEGDTALVFDTATNRLGVGTSSPDTTLHAEYSGSETTGTIFPIRVTHITSNTASSIGVGVEYELENADATFFIGGSHEIKMTGNGEGTESADYVLELRSSGTKAEKFRVYANGNAALVGDLTVSDEAYGGGWNGSLEVPTKNALYDKIETLGGGSGITRTVVTTSGSLTLGSTASVDYVYFVAGAHTLSMPSPNTNRYTIKNLHSAAITIDTAGAETIEGAASLSLQPNDSIDVMSDGTHWYVH